MNGRKAKLARKVAEQFVGSLEFNKELTMDVRKIYQIAKKNYKNGAFKKFQKGKDVKLGQ